MIGKVISGRYEIIEKLGEGGMANVYKARCRILKRFVSIKILKHELTKDEEFVHKFKVEAMEIAKLSHSNVVNVYDIGTEGDIHYIVMEYVDGKTLKQYISDLGVLSLKLAIDFSIQICNALIAAHCINLIHRDIKSQNILVSNSGVIKVTDFGIAKSSDSTTITDSGKILGSAYYISPEQAKGNFIDCRSDIYSFGVVMYEMFTGKLPFTQGTLVNVALQHVQIDPVEPIELNGKLPLGINNLILKCLQKKPILRYQSVSEIRNDLLALKNTKKYFVSKINVNDSTVLMSSLNVDDENVPKKSNSVKKSGLLKSLIILLISFLIIFAGIFLFRIKNIVDTSSKNIQIPSIVGKVGEVYKKEIESLGLKYEISGYVESDLEEDFVVDTLPRAGSSVKKGDTVKVVLSKGIKETNKIRVPYIVNKTLSEARSILIDSNLKIGTIEERFSDIYETGRVISQAPNFNSEVEKNEVVDIIVSKGSEVKLIVVPKFVGLSLVEAQNLANLSDIKIEINNVETSNKDDDQKIFDQSIPDGIEIKSQVVIELDCYSYKEDLKEEIKDNEENIDINDVEFDFGDDENLSSDSSFEKDKDEFVKIPSFDNFKVSSLREIFNEIGLELDSNDFKDDDFVKEIDYKKGEEVPVGTVIKVISVY